MAFFFILQLAVKTTLKESLHFLGAQVDTRLAIQTWFPDILFLNLVFLGLVYKSMYVDKGMDFFMLCDSLIFFFLI